MHPNVVCARPDLDAIEALSPEREALWARLEKATFLTADEKRIAVGYAPLEGESNSASLIPKSNFNPGQLRDELGRWTDEGSGGSGRPEPAARRRTSRGEGTPAQQARLDIANARAREATRRLRELQPTWEGPQSVVDPDSVEGRIAHQEATAEAAEARLVEILRDAIPNTNPSWGVNRLVKELHDQGYVLAKPTRAPGLMYENPSTGEQVRIMEQPLATFRTDSAQKHFNDFYYRYRSRDDQPWGDHVTIPNK